MPPRGASPNLAGFEGIDHLVDAQAKIRVDVLLGGVARHDRPVHGPGPPHDAGSGDMAHVRRQRALGQAQLIHRINDDSDRERFERGNEDIGSAIRGMGVGHRGTPKGQVSQTIRRPLLWRNSIRFTPAEFFCLFLTVAEL